MELNILTYNTKGRNLSDIICEIVSDYNIDIIVVNEPEADPINLLLKLNFKKSVFNYNADGCKHVNIYSKFNKPQFVCVKEFQRTTGWLFKTPLTEFVLIGTHYYDKFYNDEKVQFVKINRLVSEIEEIENLVKTDKVILTGDLNLNPYDEPAYMSNGLNALSCAEVVTRNKSREGRKTFYNPSWNLLGDKESSPGTYYLASLAKLYWNVIDQVLVRPNAIPIFRKDSLKIINKTSKRSLIKPSGIIDGQYSDHLPITFKLEL